MFKSIIQGMIIGLAGIVPGVSGGTLAVTMGIYDKLISCVTHIFKDMKESIKFLMPVAIGMALSMAGLSFVVEAAFAAVPVTMGGLFTGLVLGGLPVIWKKANQEKMCKGHLITAIFVFVVITGLPFISGTGSGAPSLAGSMGAQMKFFGVGVIASATMVIPGVSGSALLLAMGYYTSIVSHINELIKSVFGLQFYECLQEIGIMFPFVAGIGIGGFLIAKVIEIIFRKIPEYAYWGIVGLILSSPFSIMVSCCSSGKELRLYDIIIAVPALILGTAAAMQFGD